VILPERLSRKAGLVLHLHGEVEAKLYRSHHCIEILMSSSQLKLPSNDCLENPEFTIKPGRNEFELVPSFHFISSLPVFGLESIIGFTSLQLPHINHIYKLFY
jgi:hypothetical protein